MELILRGGDYMPDGKGGFCRARGSDEVLQRVLFRLNVRRGSFPFLPELGSRLYTLTREKPGDWAALAQQYAAEALREEEVTVTGTEVSALKQGVLVRVDLEWQGEDLSVSVEV